MKKFLTSISLAIMAVVVGVSFAACGNKVTSLEGTYVFEKVEEKITGLSASEKALQDKIQAAVEEGEGSSSDYEDFILEFSKDGTVVVKEVADEEGEDPIEVAKYNYSISNNVITFKAFFESDDEKAGAIESAKASLASQFEGVEFSDEEAETYLNMMIKSMMPSIKIVGDKLQVVVVEAIGGLSYEAKTTFKKA